MSSPMLTASFILFVGLSAAHPVFQHHFNNIVNSNPCLKTCMDQATVDDVELSLLKTANISGYLLNIQSICSRISTAKQCIAGCGVNSNPFALESMTVICSQESLSEVESVSKCLSEQGDEIIDQCKSQCGDYDAINNKVHQLTERFKPEMNEPSKVTEIMARINDACGTLKCSDRCATKALSEQCTPLENGKDAGSVVKALIEKVLVAQRKDLERMRLVDAMAHAVPMQCNFMYMPEVMFSTTKDEQALSAIAETQKSEQLQKLQSTQNQSPVAVAGEADQKKELNLALSQFQAHLLKKQMHLLELQEHNLMRENQKLEMELQLLARKRIQAMNEDGINKMF